MYIYIRLCICIEGFIYSAPNPVSAAGPVKSSSTYQHTRGIFRKGTRPTLSSGLSINISDVLTGTVDFTGPGPDIGLGDLATHTHTHTHTHL